MMPAPPLAMAPELRRATDAALPLQGKPADASAEDSKSRMQSFAFATTSGERSRHVLATSAFAIRTPSGSRSFASRVLVTAMARLRSAAHLDAGPLLVDTSD